VCVEIMDPAGDATLAFRVWSGGRREVPAGDVVIEEGEGWGEGRHPSTYMCLQFVWDEVHFRADPALETTQGQMDGFFSQLPYKCHQNRVASVGD